MRFKNIGLTLNLDFEQISKKKNEENGSLSDEKL